MIFNLRNETAKYDISQQLQEIHESVRLAFLNSFRDFAGMEFIYCSSFLDSEIVSNHRNHIFSLFATYVFVSGYLGTFGGELAQSRSNNNHVQNGYINGTDGETSASMDGDLHKKLLVVLSNIGYCKAELSDELYTKYRHIWSPVRYLTNFSYFLVALLKYIYLLFREGLVSYAK